VITHGREPSGDEQRAEFIAVKTRGMRFVVEARTANMRRGGMLNEVFFFGVPVEGRDRAEPPRDRRPGTTFGIQIASEGFDVHATSVEQTQVVAETPRRVLAEIQGVRVPGQAPVAGQEPGERDRFSIAEHRIDSNQPARCCRSHHGPP